MRLQSSIVEGRGSSMFPQTREGFLLSFNYVCGTPLRISFCCSWCCPYFICPVIDSCPFRFETIFYVVKCFTLQRQLYWNDIFTPSSERKHINDVRPQIGVTCHSSVWRHQFLLIELLQPQCGYKSGSWIRCCLLHYPQHWHLNYDFILSSNVSISGECKETEWKRVAVRSEFMVIRTVVSRGFFYNNGARFMWFTRHLGKVWQCCCHLWTLSQKRERDEGICSKRRWPQMIYCRTTSC